VIARDRVIKRHSEQRNADLDGSKTVALRFLCSSAFQGFWVLIDDPR